MPCDISCAFGTLLLTVANAMRVVFVVAESKRDFFDLETYQSLDSSYLQEEWDFRFSKRGIYMAAAFCNALGWVFVAYPIAQMAWVLSRRGTRDVSLNLSIILFAVGGAFTRWIAVLFWVGISIVSIKISQEYNLDDWVRDDIAGGANDGLGYKAFEVAHSVTNGYVLFVDLFEWICFGFIFMLTFLSVRQWRKADKTSFGIRWAALSVFLSMLCILEVVALILRFEGFKGFGPVAVIYAVLNRFLFLPAWLLSLAFILPAAQATELYTTENPIGSELALAELSSAPATPSNEAFTIGDDDVPATISTPAGPTSPPPEAFGKDPATTE